MSEAFKSWWLGRYGPFSIRAEWPDSIEAAAEFAWNGQQEVINGMAARYDDALKRINDMQAELEHLRAELARKA